MDRLPDELVLYILSFLQPVDLTCVQQTSARLLALGRDKQLWQRHCFLQSRAGANADARARRLDSATNLSIPNQIAGSDPAAQQTPLIDFILSRTAPVTSSLANWDPIYPNESHSYYEDYITRHADISIGWFNPTNPGYDGPSEGSEITGASILTSDHSSHHAFVTFDNGSIGTRPLDAQCGTAARFTKSKPGLLTPGIRDSSLRSMYMRDIAGVENVSVSQSNDRAYIAVTNILHEVDISRLVLVSSSTYPTSISTLSACGPTKPLVIGTNETIHVHDPRDPTRYVIDSGCKVPLTDHSLSPPYVSLEERGPLSILHPPDHSDSIWIAGRFTSLLQYSLRSFPQLISTVHSGARIASLTALPYPFVPAIQSDDTSDWSSLVNQRLQAKLSTGWTAICVGQYKGKGSLELFGFSGDEGAYSGNRYLNRQTASRTKLLAVASQCGKLLHADGDGNIKWVERDAVTRVREHNINSPVEVRSSAQQDQPSNNTSLHYGPVRVSEEVFMINQPHLPEPTREAHSDIVQKMMPFSTVSETTHHSTEKLLLWTGEGRLGVLGYGPNDPIHADEFHDAVEVQAETAAERAKRDAEVQYQSAMRRALQRNADEVRFVRGLGMAGA